MRRNHAPLIPYGVYMKGLFLVLAVVFSVNVSAIELQSYKSTGSKITKIGDSELETLWASNKAVCLKDGARMLGVNKAYKAANLGYRDCSESDSARIKAEALGQEVVVVKLAQLSKAKIKQVLGAK